MRACIFNWDTPPEQALSTPHLHSPLLPPQHLAQPPRKRSGSSASLPSCGLQAEQVGWSQRHQHPRKSDLESLAGLSCFPALRVSLASLFFSLPCTACKHLGPDFSYISPHPYPALQCWLFGLCFVRVPSRAPPTCLALSREVGFLDVEETSLNKPQLPWASFPPGLDGAYEL